MRKDVGGYKEGGPKERWQEEEEVGGEGGRRTVKNPERGYLICLVLMIIHYPVLQILVHLSYTGK